MGEPIGNEKVDMIRNLFNEGYKIMDIVKIVGVSRSTVKNYKKKYNMVSNHINIRAKIPDEKIQEIRDLEAKGLGTKAISEKVGVGEEAVRKYKRTLKPYKNNMIYPERKLPQDKVDQILNLADQGFSTNVIAKKLEIAQSTSKSYIKKFRPNIEIGPKKDPISEDKLNVILTLVDKGVRTKEIAEIVDVSINIINKYKKRYRPEADSSKYDDGSKLPEGTEKIIIALSNKGFKRKEIAEVADISIRTVIKYQLKNKSKINSEIFLDKKITEDKLNMILDLFDKGNKINYIANTLGVSYNTICKHLKKHRPDTYPNRKENPIVSEDKINRIIDLAKQGVEISDIANTVGLSKGTVIKYGMVQVINKSKQREDKVNIIKELTNKGLNITEIAKESGISRTTINKYIKEYNLNINKSVGTRSRYKIINDKNKLIMELANKGLNAAEIIKESGIDRATVNKYIKKYNIHVKKGDAA